MRCGCPSRYASVGCVQSASNRVVVVDDVTSHNDSCNTSTHEITWHDSHRARATPPHHQLRPARGCVVCFAALVTGLLAALVECACCVVLCCVVLCGVVLCCVLLALCLCCYGSLFESPEQVCCIDSAQCADRHTLLRVALLQQRHTRGGTTRHQQLSNTEATTETKKQKHTKHTQSTHKAHTHTHTHAHTHSDVTHGRAKAHPARVVHVRRCPFPVSARSSCLRVVCCLPWPV